MRVTPQHHAAVWHEPDGYVLARAVSGVFSRRTGSVMRSTVEEGV